MSGLFDLFDTPVVPGLAVQTDFIPDSQAQELIAEIEASDLAPFRFQQWTGKRVTQSFGWSYDFEKGVFAPTTPLPDWLKPVREKAAGFAGLDPGDLCQALLIRYDPGAGIGWHKDRPVFEHVVGLSLGSATTLRLRRRKTDGFDRAKVELGARSIYHLSGEVRHGWEHSIAPLDAQRWSITFRSLARQSMGRS